VSLSILESHDPFDVFRDPPLRLSIPPQMCDDDMRFGTSDGTNMQLEEDKNDN